MTAKLLTKDRQPITELTNFAMKGPADGQPATFTARTNFEAGFGAVVAGSADDVVLELNGKLYGVRLTGQADSITNSGDIRGEIWALD